MLRQEKMDFARGAAADGIVLLKNENGALPLDKNKEIALFGTCAYRCLLYWGRRWERSLWTVDLEIPKAFAACLTVALLFTMYLATSVARSSICLYFTAPKLFMGAPVITRLYSV